MQTLFDSGKYQILKSWDGKVKTITNKEFLTTFGSGQYYIPEGAQVFQRNKSDTVWCIGGAKHTKPAHWNCSDRLIKISLVPVGEQNFNIGGFQLYNQSSSKTSQFSPFAFSAGLTVESSENKLLGFMVNGKNLNCPGRELFLSNEIRIIETASDTTFRTRVIRTPERAQKVNPGFDNEILQTGEIPPPMYGSTLTPITMKGMSLNIRSGRIVGPSGTAVLSGGAVLKNRNYSNVELMFNHVSKHIETTWEERSSGGIWLLKWCLNPLEFTWKKVLEVEPRTFHTATLLGKSLLLFGGTNIDSGERLSIMPVNINTVTWLCEPIVQNLDIDLKLSHIAAHSMIKTSENSCLGIGGFRKERSVVGEEPVDSIFQIRFQLESDLVTSVELFDEKLLTSGPVAHNFVLDTPSETCILIAGGTLERWSILSNTYIAGSPCDLELIGKCKVANNEDDHEETVQWLGCDGQCKRWFHATCLSLSSDEVNLSMRLKKWYCRRSDCKKQ